MNVTDTSTAIPPVLADGWAPQERPQAEIKTVSVCDTQPVTAEGIRTLLTDMSGLHFDQGTDSLARARDLSTPSVLMRTKPSGYRLFSNGLRPYVPALWI